VVAVLLLAYSMAQWTWRIFTPPKTPIVAKTSAQAKTATLDIQDLLAGHLFGKAAPKVVPTAAPIEEIPESSLNMILTGVVAAGDDSLALIRVNDEPETPFAIGDELTRGVTLQAVYADRAIIERRGVTEALLLEDAAASLLGTPVVGAPSTPTRAAGGVQAQGNNTFTIDRASLNEQLRDQDLFRQALMVPNAGGGFLVRQIQPGSLYEKLGLKVGDVIRGVNGRSVNTVDQVLEVYQQLGGVDELTGVQLEVMRAGQIQQLQYTIQ
jgi:general secretion pathway protein C